MTSFSTAHGDAFKTSSPKPKDIQFTVIHEKEKQPILTFEMLQQEIFGHFCLKNYSPLTVTAALWHPTPGMILTELNLIAAQTFGKL